MIELPRRLFLITLLLLALLTVSNLGGHLLLLLRPTAPVTYSVPAPRPPQLLAGAGAFPPTYSWTYASVRAQIARAAAEFGVSYARLLRVAQCESGLNPTATNPYSGAAGLFQFMWPTFNGWVGNLWWARGTWLSPYNPRVASRLAAWAFSRGYAGAWSCTYIVGGARYERTPPPLWKNWLAAPHVARGHVRKHHASPTATARPTATTTATATATATTPAATATGVVPIIRSTTTQVPSTATSVPTAQLPDPPTATTVPAAPAPTQSATTPSGLSVSYTGTDYYYPSEYFGGCPNWTWLTSCYTHNPSGGSTTEQSLLSADTTWITAHHLGQFQRVWAILDQGIRWSNGAYAGLDPTYLANLDDALTTFTGAGIKVDLVVYEASQGTSDTFQFQTAALDGSHAALRSGYLQALRDLVSHLAANPTEAQTVVVLDLFNEAYYQLERFGLSDATIHQWLSELYTAAHGTAPGFLYTVSDTTRLLKDYATWSALYPVDVYDEHLYDDTPWSTTTYQDQGVSHAAFWKRAAAFTKPWFAGETGCSPGNVSCTYSGNVSCTQPASCALSVDTWFLQQMRAAGARAVLIEERNTAWAYPSGPTSQTPTLVGQAIQGTAP